MYPTTADDLAAYMQLATDERHEMCNSAAVTWVEKRRSATDPADLWADPDVHLGTLQYGALLYQTKSAPMGLPEYEEIQSAAYGSSMAGVYRLVGGPDVCFA